MMMFVKKWRDHLGSAVTERLARAADRLSPSSCRTAHLQLILLGESIDVLCAREVGARLLHLAIALAFGSLILFAMNSRRQTIPRHEMARASAKLRLRPTRSSGATSMQAVLVPTPKACPSPTLASSPGGCAGASDRINIGSTSRTITAGDAGESANGHDLAALDGRRRGHGVPLTSPSRHLAISPSRQAPAYAAERPDSGHGA